MVTTIRSTPRTASGTDTAVAPVSAAKSESVSGPREFATKTLCPSAARRRVSVPPIWPAPMIPIFMFASYGWIAEATGGSRKVASSDVAQSREHPCIEMVQQMAMERPKPRIVGVEGDHDPAPGWHQHGVAPRAGEPPAVDFDDLKLVPVQVHRMWHRRLVDEDELDALALCDG